MVKFINFTLLLSTIFTFSSSLPVAESNEPDLKPVEFNENYYSIFVNESALNKRSDASSVEAAIKDINQIINDGRRLYKDKKKLRELEKKYEDSQLVKRDISSSNSTSEETGFAFPLYSYDGYTLVYTYLHPGLLEDIESLPYVDSIEPDAKIEFTANSKTIDDIIEETGWKNVTYEEAQYHLSLLSQDASDFVDDYDNNYYYPSTAGKDVDIYLFEGGYNFNHLEFRSTKDDRTLKCINTALENVEIIDETECRSNEASYNFHGEFVSTVAGGRKHGVARKANIYGTLIENTSIPLINRALIYIKNNLLKPNRSIFNFSFINWTDIIENEHWPNRVVSQLQEIINDITEAGGIFIASSGNNGLPTKYIYKNRKVVPCGLDNVICVGGVSNRDPDSLVEKKDGKVYYRREKDSNYGEFVDLYAPYVAEIEYINEEKKNVKQVIEGTSFASPIVAGLAATIISEHDDIKFDHDTMLKYLRDNGQKGVITNIPHDDYNKDYDETSENGENVFVNNGKHIIFPKEKN